MRVGNNILLSLVILNGYLPKLRKNGSSVWSAAAAHSDELFDDLFPPDYSGNTPPGNYPYGSDNVTEITPVVCELRFYSVTSLSMRHMDFYSDLHVLASWRDHRLQILPGPTFSFPGSKLPTEITKRLWTPRLRFANLKEGDNRLITPIGLSSYFRIIKEEDKLPAMVRFINRKTFRFNCLFDFGNYPFDVQNCKIVLDMYYRHAMPFSTTFKFTFTKHVPVPPGFQLKSIVEEPKKTHKDKYFVISNASLNFQFQRVYAQHMMLIFFPSILIVMLSWVAFWLDPEVAAPRVALGLTTILTLSTMFNAAQKDLPPVADVKALDIWMFSCIFMIFASLIEFSIAHYTRKKKTSLPEKRVVPQPVYVYENAHLRTSIEAKPFLAKQQKNTGRQLKLCSVFKRQPTTSPVDYTARILFPTAFLVMNICFWSHYL